MIIGIKSSDRKSKGVTLLEVLIAIFVLSFGVLGLMALQLNALQSAAFSYQSSLSNLAAKSVKEAMWHSLLVVQEDGDGDDYVACISVEGSDARMSGIESVMTDWGFKIPGKSPGDPGVHIELEETNDCEYKVSVLWFNNRFGSPLEHGDDGFPSGFPDGNYALYEYYFRLPGRNFEE